MIVDANMNAGMNASVATITDTTNALIRFQPILGARIVKVATRIAITAEVTLNGKTMGHSILLLSR